MANALDLFDKSDAGIYTPKFEKGQRMLFVAKSGEGKSNAEISFAELGPMYFFDIDNRFKGATSASRWLGIDRLRTVDFDYYNPSDGFRAIDVKLNKIANDAIERKGKYKTIAFDSVGSLCAMLGLDAIKQKDGKKVKTIGDVKFFGPEEYNYISTAFRILMFNYIFPLNEAGVNTIFSAWVVDRWGKKPGTPEFSPAEVIGEKMLGTGNFVEENIGYFNEQYRFRKNFSGVIGTSPKYTVEFNGAFAKTALNMPLGEFDVTEKSFFKFWLETAKSVGIINPPESVTVEGVK